MMNEIPQEQQPALGVMVVQDPNLLKNNNISNINNKPRAKKACAHCQRLHVSCEDSKYPDKYSATVGN